MEEVGQERGTWKKSCWCESSSCMSMNSLWKSSGEGMGNDPVGY